MRLYLSSLIAVGLLSFGMAGCAEKSSTTEETTISTPDGSTTVKIEKEVTKSGDNPPAESQ